MRTTTRLVTAHSGEKLQEMLAGIFTAHGFSLQQYKGQTVWKKGTGWLTAPRIFRVTAADSVVSIEGWVPYALLPGVYIGESGLDSGFGIAVKIPMRNLLKEIIALIGSPDSPPEGYVPVERKKK